MGTRILGSPRQSPKGYIYGFEVTYSSATALNCGNGYCRDADDTFDINGSAMPFFNIAATGAGGRRATLVEAASTYYHCFAIADSRGINPTTTFIDDTLIPTLPAGYDKYRRVHTVRNDNASNFRSTTVVKRAGEMREIHWRYSDGSAQILSAGAAATFTSIDCSDWMPPTATGIVLLAKVSAANQGSFARFRAPQDSSIPAPPMRVYGGDTSAGNGDGSQVFTLPSSTRAVEYLVSGATCDAWAIGYIDHL